MPHIRHSKRFFNEPDVHYVEGDVVTNSILDEIRSWLAPLNKRILNHPYISEAEKGDLPLGKVEAFVANQYYIIDHDARSLALMASRSKSVDEFEFFNTILNGDAEALPLLIKMSTALGWGLRDLDDYTPIPEAVVYSHYLTSLAHFASPGEQAMALIVNLPVWGSNCKRLSRALKDNYGMEETSFLDIFARPMAESEEAALSVINRYLNEKKCMRKAARLVQAYELMFWNGIYGG